MDVTEEGIVTEVRPVHWEKALLPMVVTGSSLYSAGISSAPEIEELFFATE